MDSDVTANDFNINDAVAVLKRRLSLLVFVSVGISLIGVLAALLLPPVYRSEAIVLIEQQEIPNDLVRSTVTSFAEQRIQAMGQRVLSSANLMRLIEQFQLYEEERERYPREEILEDMRESVGLEMISADVVDPRSGRPTEATIAFSLSFEAESATAAQRVVNDLVSSFLEDNIKIRRESAEETSQFLDAETARLQKVVKALEKKMASFKDDNPNARPELESLTRDLMNRTELQLTEIDRRIHETIQKKIYLEAELAQYDPIRVEERGGQSAFEQLRIIEAQLAAARASYGPEHPDVIRLQKQADGMRVSVDPAAAKALYEDEVKYAEDELAQLLEKYGVEHPDVEVAKRKVTNSREKLASLPEFQEKAPNNPPYVALSARLDAARAELVSFESNRKSLIAKLDDFESNLLAMPDAEAEYREISREYETALAKYQELSAKQTQASLSRNLESERKGEKFTLIEPPLLAEKPSRPNRPLIMTLALAIGLMGGLGVITFVEILDDKIRNRKEIADILGVPPLVAIPEISKKRSVLGRLVSLKLIGGAIILLLIAIATVHFVFKPVDVLWFILLRKLGV